MTVSSPHRDLSGKCWQFGRCWRVRVRHLVTTCLVLLVAAAGGAEEQISAPADSTLRVGTIELDAQDIFTEREVAEASGFSLFLRKTMNSLHINTRPGVLRQELLFKSGDPLDLTRLEESERNLRRLGFLTEVDVAPTDTTNGEVDVKVTTREVWTLGLSLSFALASSGDLRWNLSLTEKNFLGYGTVVRGAIGQGLDADFGRIYIRQNRLLRTPVTVEFNYDDRSDGFSRWAAVAVPFRADNQAWSLVTKGWDNMHSVRWYLSNAGPAGDQPDRGQSLHALIPYAYSGAQFELIRRVSPADEGRVWRLGAAASVSERQWDLGSGLFDLSDGRSADLSYLMAPGMPMARDTGVTVWPHLLVSTKGRRWTKERYLQRYGNQEDIPLDVAAVLRAGPEGPSVGSTSGYGDRWNLDFQASNWDAIGRSFLLQALSATMVTGEQSQRSHYLDLLLGSYVRIGAAERPFTLKTFLEGVHSSKVRGDQAATLGLDRGLRTLDVDGMAGEWLGRWSTELGRVSNWVPLGLARTGWGVYYAGGLARWRDEDRDLGDSRHEVGVGLRLGGVRSGRADVARVDLSYDLTGFEGFVITTVSRGYF